MAITKVTLKQDSEKIRTRQKKERRQLIIMIAVMIVGICIFAGTSYAVFSTFVKGKKEQTIIAGTFTVDFKEGSNVVLDNTYPLSDEKGLKTTPYTFTIENTGTIVAMYRIKLEEDTTNPSRMLTRDQVKISYKKDSGEYTTPQLLSALDSELILTSDQTLNVGKTASFEIKMWVDGNATNIAQGKQYKTKIVVEAVQKVDRKYQDTIPPVVTLNGEKNISLTKGSSYTEPGVKSIVDDTDGTIATSNVTKKFEYYNGTTTTTVSNIDTSKKGVYYITYQATDNSGNKGLAVRTINVNEVDSTPPIITLNGEENINLAKGTTYTENGYHATDGKDGDLSNRVVVINPVNIQKSGVYVIKYIVQDDSGNIASKTRTVTVVNPTPEECFGFRNSAAGNEFKEIYEYKCTKDNSYSLPVIMDVVIPSHIEGLPVISIASHAIYYDKITSVIIPNGVSYISSDAFGGNQLTSVTIPESVTSIGDRAFSNNQLTSVIIKEKSSSANFTSYGNNIWGWASGYSDDNITWNG